MDWICGSNEIRLVRGKNSRTFRFLQSDNALFQYDIVSAKKEAANVESKKFRSAENTDSEPTTVDKQLELAGENVKTKEADFFEKFPLYSYSWTRPGKVVTALQHWGSRSWIYIQQTSCTYTALERRYSQPIYVV